MKVNELLVGDVLFTRSSDKSLAQHTQIYSGDSHFVETVLHAVDDPRRGGPSQLMATGLKTAEMHVYRCRNWDLAYGAYLAGMRWIKYFVPYDQERKYLKEAFRNEIAERAPDDEKLVMQMKLLFYEHGIFRAIKYTARRNEILCYPGEGESGRGLTCTMFAILCYQAAALESYVLTTSEVAHGSNTVRVSDKKMSLEELKKLEGLATGSTARLDPADVKAYRQYVGLLQSGNEYNIAWGVGVNEIRDAPTRLPGKPLPGYQYVPSILCWKGSQSITGFNFSGAMTEGMMVDAKIATSEHLRICMEADKVGWTNMGFIDKGETDPLDPNYKTKKSDFEQWSRNARDRFKPVVSSSSSSSNSNSNQK